MTDMAVYFKAYNLQLQVNSTRAKGSVYKKTADNFFFF